MMLAWSRICVLQWRSFVVVVAVAVAVVHVKCHFFTDAVDDVDAVNGCLIPPADPAVALGHF